MTEEDCNSWACDVANDYAQAMRENGPEDYISWKEFSNLAWRELMSQPATPCVDSYPLTLEQELPF
jgi:hypothetical protein